MLEPRHISDLEFAISELSKKIEILITAMSMQAENENRIAKGESPAYNEESFTNLLHEN